MTSLTRKQIDFIVNQKKQGKTYLQISENLAKRFGIEKSANAVRHIFLSQKHNYDIASSKSHVEVRSEIVRETIVTEFLKMVSERKHTPSSIEFHKVATNNRDAVSRQFGSFDGLIEYAREHHPEIFSDIIDDTAFTDDSYRELLSYIGKYRRFIITTAVTGREPHAKALAAIGTFCKVNKAALLILPCSDPAAVRENSNKWSLSHKLPRHCVVFRDTNLNRNLTLSTIKTSAKQIIPTTGLRRLSQKKGSLILASPKQFLEYAAKSNVKDIPRALMTTGAITQPIYSTETYMSERTAYLAEEDHKLGAIIVEIKNDRIFFFRQVQFDTKTGAFSDIDTKYHADGTVENIRADLVQIPDYHVGSTDPQAKQVFKEVVEATRPKIMTLEDFFDGYSINPHERKNKVSLSRRAKIGMLSLSGELKACNSEINDLLKWTADKLVFKYGNHEDFLNRWLQEGEFINEPENKVLGLELNLAMEKYSKMPFEFAMRELYGIDDPDKVKFLELEDSMVISGIENGSHGHLGNSGRRNPGMAELEECYGPGNFGHNHSASIYREVFRVGTATYYKMGYNKGPGKWTQTALIQHVDGSRQLINCIYGEWRLED